MTESDTEDTWRPRFAWPRGKSLWIPLATIVCAIVLTVIILSTTSSSVPPLAHPPAGTTTTPMATSKATG